MKAIKPFSTSDFRLPSVDSNYVIAPMGRASNLLDDVTAGILRQIEQHERYIFQHVHRHNQQVHHHHRRMQYVHPHHSHSSHPLHRRQHV